MDPPYWETEGYGAPFPWAQYELMAARLRQLKGKGKTIVSLNEHPDIRRCFEGFEMESLAIDYTVGGGANRAEPQELITSSWDREAEPASLF